MSKFAILIGALWGLALPALARNAPDQEKVDFFHVCSGCPTIFDRNVFLDGGPNPGDRASVDAAFKKELGATKVNAARFGKIVMEPGNRIKSVRLDGRRAIPMATASRREDGTYEIVRSNYDEGLVSDWLVEVTTDKLHGSTRVTLSVPGERIAGLTGFLLFKCVDNKLDVIVKEVEDAASTTELPVQWRIDDRPVVSETWSYSPSGASLASPQPMTLFKDLLQARKVVIRVQLRGGADRTMVFAMAGVDEFLGTLRKACSW